MSIPGRGESVGEAYVRLRVNGSGLPDDIKKEFDKLEPAMKKEGVRQSEAYREGFKQDLDKNSLKDIEDSLDGQRGKRDHIADELGGAFGARMRESLAKQFQGAGSKEIADRIFSDLDAAARRNNSLSGFNNINLSQATEKAIRDIQRDEQDLANFRAKAALAAEKAERDLTAARRDADKGVADAAKASRKAMQDLEGDTDELGNKLRGLDKIMKYIQTNDFGKFFGQGSRNNFINSFGNIVGQVARSIAFLSVAGVSELDKLAKAFKGTGSEGEDFATRLAKAIGGLGGKVLDGLGGISAGILALPAVFGIALGAIQFFVGPLIALIVDLSAVIVALASTIGIGLVGAVGALLPLLVPLILTVGVLTLGFTKLSKAQKAALAADFKPVTAQLRALQVVAQEGLFGKGDINVKAEAAALIPVMKLLTPLVKGVAGALAGVAINFTKALGNPDSKKFLDTFTVFAPQAITKLGKAFTSFFTGLGGLLRALVPEADKFLAALDKGAANFSKFTNSVSGQNKLAKFFSGAYDSAVLLYNFVKDLGIVLVTILSAGKKTGDSLFGSINKSLLTYNTYLKSAAGQQALSRFFGQIKPFLSALGALVGGLGKLFSSLNNSQSQNSLNNILTALGGFLGLIARNIPTVIPILHDFATGIGAVFKVLVTIAGFISSHEDLFRPIIVSLGALFVAAKISGASGGLGALATGLSLGFTQLQVVMTRGVDNILTGKQKLQAALSGLALVIGTSIAGSQVGGAGGAAIGIGGGIIGGALFGATVGGAPGAAIGAALGGITGAISHFWGQANQASEDAKNKQIANLQAIQTAANSLIGSIAGIGQAYTDSARQQVIANLSVIPKGAKTSPLLLAQSLGISTKELADAVGGSATALASINHYIGLAEANTTRQVTALQSKITADRAAISNENGGSASDTLHQNLDKDLDALRKLTGAQKDQKATLEGLLAALGIQSGGVKNDIILLDNQALATGKLNLATRDLASQTLAYGTILSGNSHAAQLNNQLIKDHITAMDGVATAALRAGTPIAKVTANFEAQRDALERQLVAAGYSKEAVDKLVYSLKGVPTAIASKVTVDTAKAHDDIIGINGKLDALENRKIAVNASLVGNALANLLRIQQLAQQLRNTQINIKANEIGDIHNPTAIGGIFKFPQLRTIAEAGNEAVVPLNRPLSQVDPSVRALSAFAQGKYDGAGLSNSAATTSQVNAMPSIVIQDGGAFIKTASTNADAILAEVTARWAVQGY